VISAETLQTRPIGQDVAVFEHSVTDLVPVLLASLRDIVGIRGSFVLTPDGDLVAWDVPASLTEVELEGVGQRIYRMTELFPAIGSDLHVCTIRYEKAKLFVARIEAGFLCILTEPDTQLTTTRMAATLVGRQLSTELGRQHNEGGPMIEGRT
jgi:predicted regulator of Ras-like GTPase activity (Roadblock/LC7/MglB family)